jgi:hypothetical protein
LDERLSLFYPRVAGAVLGGHARGHKLPAAVFSKLRTPAGTNSRRSWPAAKSGGGNAWLHRLDEGVSNRMSRLRPPAGEKGTLDPRELGVFRPDGLGARDRDEESASASPDETLNLELKHVVADFRTGIDTPPAKNLTFCPSLSTNSQAQIER